MGFELLTSESGIPHNYYLIALRLDVDDLSGMLVFYVICVCMYGGGVECEQRVGPDKFYMFQNDSASICDYNTMDAV